jgi:two-component system, NtrC family, sensor kinase
VSLLVKLIVLFGAILIVTTLASAIVGWTLAKSAVENEIRQRALEAARALKEELDPSDRKGKIFDAREATQAMETFLRSHRGMTAVELAVERPGPDLILRVTMGPSGPIVETSEGSAEPPKQETSTLIEGPEGRFWSVSVKLVQGRSPARLTLEASLAEADQLAAKESRVFAGVTLGGALLLILAAQLLISRLIGRPITRMAGAMAQVESGNLEVAAPLGAGREFDELARGFNAMLSRIRGFNLELTDRIEDATGDLARKNRDLAELNDLLVAARRDLTSKERLAALGQLAGTIAHELGNPLNSISGHVQLLERQADLPENARADLALVSGEIRRMTDVIRRFLDSTRGLRPAPEPTDVESLMHEALDMSLSAEGRARVKVTTDVQSHLGRVITDPSLVRHVLTNLIANAVDAMPSGGELRLSAFTEDSELCLQCSDSGSGIGPEERRRVFEPFYTTKPRGKGTGLGLAICREIARALRGRIEVESQPGQGATFTLRVPLEVPAERVTPPGPTPELAEAS